MTLIGRPRTLLAHLLAGALALGGVALVPSAAQGAEGDPVTWVTAVSEAGDPVGEGRSYIWRPGSGEIQAAYNEAGHLVVESGGGTSPDSFRFVFAAPAGSALATGEYTDAQDLTTRRPDQAGLEVTGGGRSCATSTGNFRLQIVAPDRLGLILHYVYRCAGQPAMFGEVHLNMNTSERVMVIPSSVIWPDTDLYASARQVPVTIVNNSSEPVTVESLYVNSSAGGFDGVNTCTGAAPNGGTCTVLAKFRPYAPGTQGGNMNMLVSPPGIGTGIGMLGTASIPPTVGAPPYPPQGPAAEAQYDAVELTWRNPVSLDFDETFVRYAVGTTPPATMKDGTEAYRGPGNQAWVEGLQPGVAYSFSFFARDTEGLVSPPTTVTLGGTSTSLTVDRSKVVWGGAIRLRGTVRDVLSGQPVAFPEVHLGAVGTDGATFVVGTVTGDMDGRFSLSTKPPKTFDFLAVHPGNGSRLGSYTGLTKVKVAALVLLDVVKTRIARGQSLQVVASAGPVDRRTPVVLQQRVGTQWKTIAQKRPNKDGTAVFTVKPATKGTIQYRAYRPAAAGTTAGTSKTRKVTVT